MSKGRMVAVLLILSAVAFYAGLEMGDRFKAAESALTDTVVVSERLAGDVELLSLLRQGENEDAIKLLETGLDRAVVNLSGDVPVAELSPITLNTLLMAKIYRKTFPPSEEYADSVKEVLVALPEPGDEFAKTCTPGIRRLFENQRDR